MQTYASRVDSWRFRNDDGNKATATFKAPERVNATIPAGEAFRIRWNVGEYGGAGVDVRSWMQFSVNGGGWADVAEGAAVSLWHTAFGTGINANGVIFLLPADQLLTNGPGQMDYGGGWLSRLAGNTGWQQMDVSHYPSAAFEVEYTVRTNGVAPGSTIQLRLMWADIYGGLQPNVTALSTGVLNPSFSVVAATGPPTEAPALAVTGSGDGFVALGWTTVAEADTYELQRKLTSQGDASYATIQNTSATSRNDTGRTNGTSYSYRVRAVNGGGAGPWSNVVSAVPLVSRSSGSGAMVAVVTEGGGIGWVQMPLDLAANWDGAAIRLNWNENAEATRYEIRREVWRPGA